MLFADEDSWVGLYVHLLIHYFCCQAYSICKQDTPMGWQCVASPLAHFRFKASRQVPLELYHSGTALKIWLKSRPTAISQESSLLVDDTYDRCNINGIDLAVFVDVGHHDVKTCRCFAHDIVSDSPCVGRSNLTVVVSITPSGSFARTRASNWLMSPPCRASPRRVPSTATSNSSCAARPASTNNGAWMGVTMKV